MGERAGGKPGGLGTRLLVPDANGPQTLLELTGQECVRVGGGRMGGIDTRSTPSSHDWLL